MQLFLRQLSDTGSLKAAGSRRAGPVRVDKGQGKGADLERVVRQLLLLKGAQSEVIGAI